MPYTIPSKVFAIVDVPEVRELSVGFVYNFFTKDEMINDAGHITSKNLKSETPTDIFFDRYVPRYINLEWATVPTKDTKSIGQKTSLGIVSANLSKIYNESSFVADNYTAIGYQEKSLESKVNYYTSRLAQVVRDRAIAEGQTLDDARAVLDEVQKILSDVDNTIDIETLIQGLSQPQTAGHSYDTSPLPQLVELQETGLDTQLNARLVHTAVARGFESQSAYLDQVTQTILKTLKESQDKAIAQFPSTVIDGRDYDFIVSEVLDVEAVDADSFKPTLEIVGYLIQKTEYTISGDVVRHYPIAIDSATIGSYRDTQIKYGSRYEYDISTVAMLKIQANDSDVSEVVAVSFLVSSKPTYIQSVECVENVAPKPPADFKTDWDYQKNLPRLTWSFPTNSQRDIKYFQVFRRKTIHQPFELVRMYDFNDSLVPLSIPETPSENLVKKSESPVCLYIDNKFDATSYGETPEYIYAVCSVDARGLSSNYSPQFKLRFNKYTNKPEVTLVCLSGAPKAYPNMTLNIDTFVDTMRVSGKNSVKVVFSPEYYVVKDEKGVDLGAMKPNSRYILSMINTDLQEQQAVTIQLSDRRSLTRN